MSNERWFATSWLATADEAFYEAFRLSAMASWLATRLTRLMRRTALYLVDPLGS